MARILILNQYYSPDTAATGSHATAIAESLAAAGHEVEALVGQPSYGTDASDAPASERREGVLVTRLTVGRRRGRERMTTRVGGYLRYLAGTASTGLRRRPEVVLSFHTPPPLPLLGLLIARRSRAALVYVPQDIHPDILVATGFLRLPRIVRSAWDAFNRAILVRADRTVALGEGMRATLVSKGADPERVVTIPLWAEPELSPRPLDQDRRGQLGVADRFVVLYAGNLGVMHPLEAVLRAARRLDDEGVSFLFAGGGVRREHWRQMAQELGVTNASFLDFQHGEDFASLVAAADATLVTLERGMERLAVPSRSFAFLAAGRPIIAAMAEEADVAQIVTGAGAGWQISGEEDLVGLLRRLRASPQEARLAGGRAREAFEKSFTRAAVTARYGAVVAALGGSAGAESTARQAQAEASAHNASAS